MKKNILITTSYIIEIDKTKFDNEKYINSIYDTVSQDIKFDEHITLKWCSLNSTVLEQNKMNCGKCCNCGNWVTNIEKKNIIKELSIGAEVDGKLLCDECLPKGHLHKF